MRYYKLYIEKTENDFYTYLDEKDEYELGDWVEVNFNNRKKIGLLVALEKEINFSFKVLKINKKAKGYLKFSKEMIKLFLFVRRYYLASFGDVLNSSTTKRIKPKEVSRCIFEKPIIPMNEKEQEFLSYIQNKKEAAKSTLVTKFSSSLVKDFLARGIIREEIRVVKEKKDEIIDEKEHYKRTPSILNSEQKDALLKIENSDKRYYLLKGVTGSGKTEVYIELIKDAIERKEGAIFLVPEISLTPQMLVRFKEEFRDRVAILHSKLTPADRAKEWNKIYTGEKDVVVGVRSAIFAPVKNLKYIIIDEEHETTYKQDSSPRYNAKIVAMKRGEIEGAKVILGSATPSIESYYYAKQGVFELVELNNRYNNAKLPKLELVDMSNESNQFFSKRLITDIVVRARKKEQSMLLLNRKGFSTYIQCQDCGEVEKCPHCSISLNYYKSENAYRCNYCGYTKRYSKICSSCNSENLKFSGKGTESLETELKESLDLKVLRVDADTTKDREAYNRIYKSFLNKEYDLMLGTQIISKGLHFPDVTLVGIITADTILNFPDFRAGEKTFQLISQASGRAGRGDKEGEVVVQTYQPENKVIEKILNNDFEGLYKEEIANRKILFYPPFSRLINIIISSKSEEGLKSFSQAFYNMIKSNVIEIYGPMPAPIYKIKGRYRYQIFVKGKQKDMAKFKKILNEAIWKSKSEKYRIIADVDPINLM